MAPLHVRAARGRRMFNPSQHQTQWKRVKKVRSYFSPEHTITGVFRAGVQDVGDVTRGTCLRAHTGVDRKEKERRTRGVKRYIQDMDVSSPHTRPLVVENATRKSPGFRPLAPPVVRWANFVSEGKLPRPVENSDKQNDIDEDEMTQACDDYRLRKAADPAWFELQRRARSAFRSAQWCLHNAFFLQRGPASNAWSQRGSHKFYKTYKKEKVNTLALMMRCPLSHMTASQTPEANRKRAQRTSEGGSVPPFFFLRVWETTECNNIIALSVFLIRNHQGNTV